MKKTIFTALLLFAIFTPLLNVFGEVLQEITVKEGDTLWSVANYYLKDPKKWPDMLKYNSLPSSDPNIILPGMRLKVPILLIKEHLRAAILIYLLQDVRYRRKDSSDWNQARLNMELYNEDGLRTLVRSKANVKFPSGELLRLDENSLVILKPDKSHEEITLLSGGVRASMTKVLVSDTIVNPKIEAKSAAPDFKTRLREDKSTLVEVYEGIVDVTAQGKTVTLTKGFGTEVKLNKAPALPRALPPSPNIDIDVPDGSTVKPSESPDVYSGNFELKILIPKFPQGQGRSQGDSGTKVLGQIVNKFNIQISTAFAFSDPVVDEIREIKDKASFDFNKYNLKDGAYYYRYSYVDDLGFQGRFSNPIRFEIDTKPPSIENIEPADGSVVDDTFIHLKGKTEPRSTLNVNGKTVWVENDGTFYTAIMSGKKKTDISITVKDRAGNISQKTMAIFRDAGTMKERTAKKDFKVKSKGISFVSATLALLTATVIIGVLVLILR